MQSKMYKTAVRLIFHSL